MSCIPPPVHAHSASHESAKPSSVVNPTMSDDSGQSKNAPSLSQTSSSGLGDLPGTFPRDPHIPLDRLNDQATTDSAHNDSLYDAARDDVRHAFGVAAQYLPQSVVGAIGSVLPIGTTDAHDVNKKLNQTKPSHNGNSGKDKQSLFDPKNTAVAGITSEFSPSPQATREAPSAPSDSPTNSTTVPGADSNASDDPLKKGHADTYAPANFASDSSMDKSSIAPDAMPAPDAGENVKVNDHAKKPAFVTYAPAPVVTDSKPSRGAENTPSTTRQRTAPSVAQALDSTAKRDTSSRTPADRPNTEEDTVTNEHPSFAEYAPAPIITDSRSPQTTSNNGGTPASKELKQQKEGDLSGKPLFAGYAPAPGITDSQASARATDNNSGSAPSDYQGIHSGKDVQKSGESEIDADSKRKRAAEAAALGAGIGTLGGATYEYSHSSAKDPSAADSHNPFNKTNKGVLSSSSGAPQARGTSASASEPSAPESYARDARQDRPIASATGESHATRGLENRSPASTGGADSTPKQTDKQYANQGDPEPDREAEKARHRREKEAAAAAASAEAAHKYHQKEMEKEHQKAEHQAKEREREVKRHEKEVAAAAAAADKEKRDKEKASQKEQHRLEKEAHEREKDAKRHEKDIAAAAVAAEKRQGADQVSNGKEAGGFEDSSDTSAVAAPAGTKNASLKEEAIGEKEGTQDKGNPPSEEKEAHEIAAAALAAAAADRERKRHSTEESTSSNQKSAVESKKTASDEFYSGGVAARPGPTALGRSDSIDPAKSGMDSDFPLEHADGGGAPKVPAVDLDGKGKGSVASTAPEKTSSAAQPEHDKSRYHGTEGVQEKHDGGALKSSTIDRNSGKAGEENDHGDKDNDNGKGDKGFVKHMVEKMKDKFHY